MDRFEKIFGDCIVTGIFSAKLGRMVMLLFRSLTAFLYLQSYWLIKALLIFLLLTYRQRIYRSSRQESYLPKYGKKSCFSCVKISFGLQPNNMSYSFCLNWRTFSGLNSADSAHTLLNVTLRVCSFRHVSIYLMRKRFERLIDPQFVWLFLL